MINLMRLALVMCLVACGHDTSTSGDQDAAATGDGSGSGSGTVDAAPPDGSTAGVTCGMMTCTTGMECCTTFANQMPSYACIASGGQCQGLSQACDGPEDCTTSGDVCCARFGGGGGGVTCEAPGGQGCRELCHTAADCKTAGSMCCMSQFGNYSFCAAMCP